MSSDTIAFTQQNTISTINNCLTILLTTGEDDIRPIYLAGNFNNWKTQDSRFKMEKLDDNRYSFSFKNDFDYPEELLYKFTKGDWDEVELNDYGNATDNRHTRIHNGIQNEYVAHWKTNGLPFKPNFLPQLLLISDEFEITQLQTTRKIWALLPHNYDDSDECYPVLYLQDAQHLFNDNYELGNWEIDKKLAIMSEYNLGKIIIIAVEHAEDNREKEYNVGKSLLGKGQGKKYIRFIIETLKPYVDANFKTKTEREFTGIGGSSLGAMVSIFSGLRYPEVFGKLMIFSPSLWIAPKFKIKSNFENVENTKIYLYAGGEESDTLIEEVKNFSKSITSNELVKDKIKINLSFNVKGKHHETYWSAEFPKAIEWLFFKY